MKKTQETTAADFLVRPTGLEPVTYGLEVFKNHHVNNAIVTVDNSNL